MADVSNNPKDIPLSGRLITGSDPIAVGENFRELKNLAPVDKHLQAVHGMSRKNPTAGFLTTVKNGLFFKKEGEVESNLIFSGMFDPSDTLTSVIAVDSVPPADFTLTTYNPANSSIYGRNGSLSSMENFSLAPLDGVVICDGSVTKLWRGRSFKLSQFLMDTATTETIDRTDSATNALTDAENTIAVSGFNLYIRTLQQIAKIFVTMATANTTPSVITVSAWNGQAYVPVGTTTDGTSLTGRAFGQSGIISFSIATEGDHQPNLLSSVSLLTYRLTFSVALSATTRIAKIRVDTTGARDIVDIWDGEYRKTLGHHLFETYLGGKGLDFTSHVFEDTYDSTNEGTFARWSQLGNAAGTELLASNSIVVGFTEPMSGIFVRMAGKFVATVFTSPISSMKVDYFTDTGQRRFPFIDDQTAVLGRTLSRSGTISWGTEEINHATAPQNVERPRQLNNGPRLYYYILTVEANTFAELRVAFIGGIPKSKRLKPYRFPFQHGNRLFLLDEINGKRNRVICSSIATANVFNGKDSGDFEFGDGLPVLCGVGLYQELGQDLRTLAFIFKSGQTWLLEGNTQETWRQFILSDDIGCPAPLTPKAAWMGENLEQRAVIWQGTKGIYISNGSAPRDVSYDIRNFFDETKAEAISDANIGISSSFVDVKNHRYHWLFASGTSTVINKEFVLDLRRMIWSEISRGAGKEIGFGMEVKTANDVPLVYGGSSSVAVADRGKVFQLESGQTFDTLPIVCSLQTGDFALAPLSYESTIRKVKAVFAGKNATPNKLKITHFSDTKAAGTVILEEKVSVIGKRCGIIPRSTGTEHSTFHSLQLSLTTSNETPGLELLALSVLHKITREDGN
jgi:hypothetical protein